MKIVYQCETCKGVQGLRIFIFHCLGCEQEICESCMFGWQHCKKCIGIIGEENAKIVYEKYHGE